MPHSPKAGQVHALPSTELDLPLGKKPRFANQADHKKKKGVKKRRGKKLGLPEPCSAEDVIWRDVTAILGQDVVDQALEDGTEFDSPYEFHQELEIEVSGICSNGT